MNKVLSLLLMIILVCLIVLPLTSCSAKPDYDYVFVTDLHVVANSLITPENFAEYASKDKVEHITEAILNSLVDEFIEKDYEYVLVGGDITENGDEASHLVAAAAFARLEDEGIDVFVVNGNHDIAGNKGVTNSKISATRFKEIYADFGYDEAIVNSPNTLSYVAKVDKKHRLIGVDNMIYYGDADKDNKAEAMSESHIEWIKKQVEQCKEDKVTPIVIAHDTLINHFPEAAQLVLDRTNNVQYEKLVKYLANNKANYVFAGHDHIQDILTYVTDEGNSLYEIAAGSMAFYPCAYKEMSFKNKTITINTCSFDAIKAEYLPSACPENMKVEITNSLQNYVYGHFYNYTYNMLSSTSTEITEMNVSGAAHSILEIIANEVIDKVFNNPLYIKDEDNNTSLERILQSYGITIPVSIYNNVSQFLTHMLAKLLGGDENLTGAPDLDLAKYACYSMFYYLNDASPLIAAAVPDYPVMNINLEKLFIEGSLECYESNFIPFFLKTIDGINSTIASLIRGFIGTNFDEIDGKMISDLVKGYSNGIVENLGEFFDSYNLLLGKLIDEGIWGNYAKDFVVDKAPSDTFIVIEID